jgi:hypothetical protein
MVSSSFQQRYAFNRRGQLEPDVVPMAFTAPRNTVWNDEIARLSDSWFIRHFPDQ